MRLRFGLDNKGFIGLEVLIGLGLVWVFIWIWDLGLG